MNNWLITNRFFRSGPSSQQGGSQWKQQCKTAKFSKTKLQQDHTQPFPQPAEIDTSCIKVRGRLSQFRSAWTTLNIKSWLLTTILTYYRIPFTNPPPLTTQPSSVHPSNQQQQLLLQLEINSRLQKGAIEFAPPAPGFFSNLFVIPKKNEGYRPVFNLKKLNTYIDAPQLQNGDVKGYHQTDQSEQLHDINRLIRCISAHTGSPTISSTLKNPSAKPILSILYNPFWPISRSMVIHQNNQTYLRMGQIPEHPGKCIPRLLDNHRQLISTKNPTHQDHGTETTSA
ncbi:hypothetical protein BDB01DRAFT_851926 [Pilobolus umbonatus]|nr:hypothetical protein BDB01DRAFT_851926 [Pilobolus umbonatus]